jgi:hypothetical protein
MKTSYEQGTGSICGLKNMVFRLGFVKNINIFIKFSDSGSGTISGLHDFKKK